MCFFCALFSRLQHCLLDRKIFVREDREEDPEFRARRGGGGAGGNRQGQYVGNRGHFSNG